MVELQKVYEVRCPRCETSFAPETRRCVHCGGPVHAGGPVAAMGGGQPPAEPGSGTLPDDPDEVEEDGPAGGARGLLWILTGLLAAAGALARNCQGG